MQVIPGELRRRDVRVAGHIAISAPAVPRFLARFEEAYSRLGKAETILAAAESSQRLIEHGVLVSESSRAPLRLALPAALASRWMPGLFPDRL